MERWGKYKEFNGNKEPERLLSVYEHIFLFQRTRVQVPNCMPSGYQSLVTDQGRCPLRTPHTQHMLTQTPPWLGTKQSLRNIKWINNNKLHGTTLGQKWEDGIVWFVQVIKCTPVTELKYQTTCFSVAVFPVIWETTAASKTDTKKRGRKAL